MDEQKAKINKEKVKKEMDKLVLAQVNKEKMVLKKKLLAQMRNY